MDLPSAQWPDPKLARGTVFFKVDVLPREPIQVTIDGGLSGGDFRGVSLSITHRDVYSGYRDITDMLVWGDVDPNFHPRIGQSSGVSDWMNYVALLPIVLSAGAGTKTINCQMRTKARRLLPVASSTYAMTANTPHITVLRQSRRANLLSTSTATLAWSCSHAFASYGVYLAPNYDAHIEECMLLGSGTNVSGGAGAAGQLVESSFTSADLQTVAVSSAVKDGIYPILTTGSTFVKVFATTAAGVVTS